MFLLYYVYLIRHNKTVKRFLLYKVGQEEEEQESGRGRAGPTYEGATKAKEDRKAGSGGAAKSGNKVGIRNIGKLMNGRGFDKNTSFLLLTWVREKAVNGYATRHGL
ncbi:hypothetical protein JCM33374_g6448 [Metschnikowia sp. JCM 33374]|nr:hypothetical protein JCM33374_g6448 [Metschnikowia sp. JCM 33374]